MSELEDVRAALARPAARIEDGGLRQAAVAMLISPGRRVWFIQRAERPGDPWSGHVAFPGGHHEPGDPDLLATARRETVEETGLELDGAEVLGDLDDLRTRPVLTKMIRPYVFRLDHTPVLRPSAEAVAYHSLTLDELLAGHGRTSFSWPMRGLGVRLPCVELPGARLWGLTLQVVDTLLHRIDGRGVGLERPVAR